MHVYRGAETVIKLRAVGGFSDPKNLEILSCTCFYETLRRIDHPESVQDKNKKTTEKASAGFFAMPWLLGLFSACNFT